MKDYSLVPVTEDMLKGLSKQELYTLILGEQSIRRQMQDELDRIKTQFVELEDSLLDINGKFVRLKARLFTPSSEKSKPNTDQNKGDQAKSGSSQKKKRTDFKKLPSQRYPNVPIIEKELELETAPDCKICNSPMQDSGLEEVNEYLTVEPKKYTIVRQIRHKYRCSSCHSSMVTTPQLPRIKPGSSYSDEMIIDIALSKYCDLIPVERYAAMAARDGFEGLPANSLIEATHHLGDFLLPTKHRIKDEVLSSAVISADETPHKMLEGDKKTRNWFLWGFSSQTAAYFECHNTRSGDIASSLLEKSKAEILLSDVYSGYSKAIRITNNSRSKKGETELKTAYCNAHARRKFKDAESSFEEQVAFYLRCYRIIYRLESWGHKSNCLEKNRNRMRGIFEKILATAAETLKTVSEKSEIAKAIKYFQKNYDGLTYFLGDARVPIDNNAQESLLRNPVIGRKTWYGTHSKRGAKTAATMFTITESCKLNKVNPREYVKKLVQAIHQGKPIFTPAEFKENSDGSD